MGAIFPNGTKPCANCGTATSAMTDRGEPTPDECALCIRLGDRSLVRIIRLFNEATTEAERADIRARFAAAKGRSHT